jgi:hypothetical protein
MTAPNWPELLRDLPHAAQVAAILTAAPEAIKSAWGSFMGRRGGRPRSDAPRCACGKMTSKRAEARRHKC